MLPALLLVMFGCGGGGSSTSAPSRLTLSAATLPTGTVGVAYSSTLSASGGTTPYAWTIASGTLPAGLSLSSQGVISGTPTANATSTFTVQVSDSAGSPQTATAQMAITIFSPLSVATTSLANAIVGKAYSATLQASGGETPYAWSTVAGQLPAGLSLSAGGTISGTPSESGTASVTFQVADSESPAAQATAQLSLTVVDTLTITTASLPNGILNQQYSAQLAASGGVTPYTWSVASGAPPSGLALSAAGTLSGTPTMSGSFTFDVQVADAETPAQTVTAQLGVTIAGPPPVLTEQYDNSRSGHDLTEAILTPSKVNVSSFGKLFSVTLDGMPYAQPLYVASVNIAGKGTHNVVYVVTEHDSVYALDADDNTGTDSSPLWQASFIDPANGITSISSTDTNCNNVVPEIGITSTPVIDPATNTLYVLAETKEHGQYFHRLHALDITSGAEKFGGPVAIQASVPGNGDGSSGGIITFDPLLHLNRPALLLANGSVYLAWGTNCDIRPAHGWVMAYDKSSLQQQAVWASTPNGQLGGIWMSGGGLAADAEGNVYVSIGNGTFDTSGTPTDFGDSIVKLTLSGGQLNVADYFTPYDEGTLEDSDTDVGSGGVLLLPDQTGAHPHELIAAGKGASLYVVDRDNMGHYNSSNNGQIVQDLLGVISGMFAVPAYWNGNVFFGSGGYPLQAFTLSNGLLSNGATSQGPSSLGYPAPRR